MYICFHQNKRNVLHELDSCKESVYDKNGEEDFYLLISRLKRILIELI